AATSGPEISEEEHEVILREEEPVVEKRVVPRERVRLDKDTVTGEERVAEEVRKEQIDVDDEDTKGGRQERRRRRERSVHAVALVLPIHWPEHCGRVMIEAMACLRRR